MSFDNSGKNKLIIIFRQFLRVMISIVKNIAEIIFLTIWEFIKALGRYIHDEL